VTSKWIYKIKHAANDNIKKYKSMVGVAVVILDQGSPRKRELVGSCRDKHGGKDLPT
jgi:hypothetical protein